MREKLRRSGYSCSRRSGEIDIPDGGDGAGKGMRDIQRIADEGPKEKEGGEFAIRADI